MSNKIYVLIEVVEYEGFSIVSLHRNEEDAKQAKAACEVRKRPLDMYYQIEEHELV